MEWDTGEEDEEADEGSLSKIEKLTMILSRLQELKKQGQEEVIEEKIEIVRQDLLREVEGRKINK